MNILSPSLLSIDFNHIERNAKVLDEAGVKWFHLDVMDGTFVRNISFGPPVIKCIRKVTDSFFDVHLMINEPIDRKSTRLNSSHRSQSRMPSSA